MENYKQFAIDIAKEAGKIITDNFKIGMEKKYKWGYSPVTETDIKINQLVIDEVRKNFPTHAVLAEEQSDLKDKYDYLWVCDPVDGTIPFSHGVPVCTFSIALVDNDGQSLLGVIYDPFMNRMFVAEKGKGAFLNDNKISVNQNANLENNYVTIDAWPKAKYDLLKLEYQLREATGAAILRYGSLCYSGVLVAAGEFTASIFAGNTAHDVAALKVIVEEAGGKVTDLFGNDQRYDKEIKGAIISNGLVHNQILQTVSQLIGKGPNGA
jgi:fructose-1,6-bisphosphatase/inositol monophosphatase family enzyme